jgi:hypothetical protein
VNEQRLRETINKIPSKASQPRRKGEKVASEACCSTAKNGAGYPSTSKPAACPSCGKKGKPVAVLTVKSLVRDHTRILASVFYSFCRAVNCDVVYFSDQAVFKKPDLKVRVGIKDTTDPIPLCYCFDYSREDVHRDIESSGSTTILEEIKAEIQGGFCACPVKNPSGACCLGDITRVIQEARKAGLYTACG